MQKLSPARSLAPQCGVTAAALAPGMAGGDNAWHQSAMIGPGMAPDESSGPGCGVLSMFAAEQGGAGDGSADPATTWIDEAVAGHDDLPIWATTRKRTHFGHRASGTGFDDDSDLEYDDDATWERGPGGKSYGYKHVIKKFFSSNKNREGDDDDEAMKQRIRDAGLWEDDEVDEVFKNLKSERDEEKKDKSLKDRLAKYGITEDSASFGSFRDETQIDVSEFIEDRSDRTWDGVGSYSRTSIVEGRDGTEHATHNAQSRAGTTVGVSGSSEVRDGSSTTRSGGSANATADVNAEASAGSYELEDGVGVRAGASARVGASARANGGVKRTHDLGNRVSGNLEAGGEVDSFVGAEVQSNATAEAVRGRASAQAGASGAVGAHATGKGAAQASLNAGRTRILGVRGKAEGEAFAGAKAGVDGQATACIKEGVNATAGGSVMAGAEAKGEVSVGATLGGVDADIVAEGEAFAGAKADAKGDISFGPTGGEASFSGQAFAGATAEGSVAVVLGAAGLSFGQLELMGRIKAGIGGKIDFGAKVKDGEIAGHAEVSAAKGIGMGKGVKLTGDVLFIPRLVVDQVVKNGPVVAADNDSANMDGCNWIVAPTGGAVEDPAAARPPATEQPLSTFLKGLDETAAAPYVEQQAAANQATEDAYDDIGTSANGALTSAMSMLGRLGPTMLDKIFAAEEAFSEATEAIDQLIAGAGDHAGAILGTLSQVGFAALGELGSLLATPVWILLDMDFEDIVEHLIERVDRLIREIQVALHKLLAQTRDAVANIGTRAGRAILAPIRGIADVAGGVVSDYGMEIVGPAQHMVELLEGAFGPAEEGIEVPGAGAMIKIAHAVTPGLDPGRKVLADGATFFGDAAEGSFGQVIESIAAPILASVFVDAPLKVLAFGETLLEGFEDACKAVWDPIQGLVRTAAYFVAPAINGFRDFLISLGLRSADTGSVGHA